MRQEEQTQVNYYVSLHGDDRAPGTEREPFATLDRARRELRSTGTAGVRSATVWLREGTHYVGVTFALTAEDSGTEEAPIRYRAYPGERPVISGGMRLHGKWEPYRDGIWVCEIPEWRGVSKESLFTELYVNGARQIRARYPNTLNGEPAYLRPLHEPPRGLMPNSPSTPPHLPARIGLIRKMRSYTSSAKTDGATCNGA